MKRTVELRPAARRDLDRFDRFLLKMSAPAAQRRMSWLRAELAALADNPLRGRSTDRHRFELLLRYARAIYIVRYRLSDDKVVITRIWHGKQRRPLA